MHGNSNFRAEIERSQEKERLTQVSKLPEQAAIFPFPSLFAPKSKWKEALSGSSSTSLIKSKSKPSLN